MITVTVQYRPVPFLWFKRKKDFTLPEHWSELNAAQFETAATLRGTVDEWKLVRLFLGVSRFFAKRLDSYHRYCILRQLSFINKVEICDRFIIPRLGKLKSPSALLESVTFGQFIFADTYFQKWTEHKRIEDLDMFIAFMYLEKGFNNRETEGNASYVSKFSIEMREAIAFNYKMIREWLAQLYPYVFEKGEPGDNKKSNKGWVSVFDAVVGDDIVNQEKYAEKPLSVVMRYLNRKRLEHIKKPK